MLAVTRKNHQNVFVTFLEI